MMSEADAMFAGSSLRWSVKCLVPGLGLGWILRAVLI